MSGKFEDLLPTRRSLLSRLKNWDDQQSWRDFFESYWRLIFGVARKSGLGEAEAEDVVQETLVSVAKEIPGFRYDPQAGSFKGWLLRITRRRIADHCRKQASQTRRQAGLEVETEEVAGELESIWEEEWQQNLVRLAVERVKRSVHPKQYQMFDLYVTQQLPMSEVTSTLGVNPAQVYMAKYRVGGLLRKELKLLDQQPL